jgi:hypothetical protein
MNCARCGRLLIAGWCPVHGESHTPPLTAEEAERLREEGRLELRLRLKGER